MNPNVANTKTARIETYIIFSYTFLIIAGIGSLVSAVTADVTGNMAFLLVAPALLVTAIANLIFTHKKAVINK